MTETDALPLSSSEAELNFVAKRVTEAAEQVQRGGQVDFSPLTQNVDRLCNGLLKLPGIDAKRLAERLPDIIKTLDRLTATLQAREPIKLAPDSRVSHQQATKAYGIRRPKAPGRR